MSVPPIHPVPEDQRLHSIDTLRGIALLGILLLNIPFFALPDRYSESFRTDLGSIDYWIRTFNNIVFEGKMRAIFSIVFGVGILLFMKKEDQVSNKRLVVWAYFRRMGWLIVFGLVDAHLILWEGDILYHYGVVGMIAVWFRRWKPIYLAIGFPIVALVEFVAGTLFFQEIRSQRLAYREVVKELRAGADTTESHRLTIDAWRQSELTFLPNEQDIASNTQKMKSGYATVAEKVRKAAFTFQSNYLIFAIWDPLVLMLLGMALFKSGFFTYEWSARQYKKAIWWGYGLGVPIVIWEAYYHYVHFPTFASIMQHLDKTAVPWHNLLYPVQRILLSTAHCSVVLVCLQKGYFTGIFTRLAAVGRMALTNYIMQAVFATLFFFGYGLNFFAELAYHQIFYFVLAVWAVQLVWSPWWLSRYHYGPLEWLWRCLTYREWQPLRKKKSDFSPKG
jgi:uncharacterized protein